MSHDDCACPISAEVSIDQPPKNQRSRVSAAWVPFWAVPRSRLAGGSGQRPVFTIKLTKSQGKTALGRGGGDGSRFSRGSGRDKPAPTKEWLGFSGALFLGGGEEGGGEFFVEGEEVFDALAVVVERLGTVAEVNGAVEGSVGFDERGRHGQRIVKVGERRVGELLARVQHGLRGGFDGGALLVARRFGPREIREWS